MEVAENKGLSVQRAKTVEHREQGMQGAGSKGCGAQVAKDGGCREQGCGADRGGREQGCEAHGGGREHGMDGAERRGCRTH